MRIVVFCNWRSTRHEHNLRSFGIPIVESKLVFQIPTEDFSHGWVRWDIWYTTTFDKKQWLGCVSCIWTSRKAGLEKGQIIDVVHLPATAALMERTEQEIGRESHHVWRLYPSTGNTFSISHLFSCRVKEGENRHAYFSCSFSWTIWCCSRDDISLWTRGRCHSFH